MGQAELEFSRIIFNPGAFVDIMERTCADTFRSAEWVATYRWPQIYRLPGTLGARTSRTLCDGDVPSCQRCRSLDEADALDVRHDCSRRWCAQVACLGAVPAVRANRVDSRDSDRWDRGEVKANNLLGDAPPGVCAVGELTNPFP